MLDGAENRKRLFSWIPLRFASSAVVSRDCGVKWFDGGTLIVRATTFTPSLPFKEPYKMYDHYASLGQ